MFQKIAAFYENHIKHLLFPKDDLSDLAADNLHVRKITRAGKDIRNTCIPLKKRVQAASHLGLLAYTGGSGEASQAGHYMGDLINFLLIPDLSDHEKVTILQSLSGICYGNTNTQKQAKELNLYGLLLSYLHTKEVNPLPDSHESIKLKFWTCYLLNILCCNNIPVIKMLNHDESLQRNLEILAHKGWYGWPNNYAQVLLYLLGYHFPKTDL
ncbi:hypothetical protein HHUSO_G5196 [Huso huso]|uniref:Armadillo like helical domain containing 2 n=1 Tax=Huso huso TaxID=61971 RepID=A0ABR1A0K1_HUSHU